MNVGSSLPRPARYRDDHLALVVGDVRLSFRELNRYVAVADHRGSVEPVLRRLRARVTGEVVFCNEFPRNVAGKTLRRQMRAEHDGR
jgi:acyl-coenzyme A synthetase/AMP-(fatty) acid ligase